MRKMQGFQTAIPVLVRILAAVGGGYGASAGLMLRSEAMVPASMLAFLVYLVLLIWAFADRRLLRVCGGMAVTSVVSWSRAWLLAGNIARLPAGN